MIVIGLPVYEMWTTSVQSKQKAKALDDKITRIEEKIAKAK